MQLRHLKLHKKSLFARSRRSHIGPVGPEDCMHVVITKDMVKETLLLFVRSENIVDDFNKFSECYSVKYFCTLLSFLIRPLAQNHPGVLIQKAQQEGNLFK